MISQKTNVAQFAGLGKQFKQGNNPEKTAVK